MTAIPLDTTVEVVPFDHNRDGDEVIIGRAGGTVLLCLPPDGFDLLQSLAGGLTVGAAARRYEEKYGEAPDIADFLRVMAGEGFVIVPGESPAAPEDAAGPARGLRKGWSLDWITPAVAMRLCAAPVLIVCGLLTALGVALVVYDPDVVPGPWVLLFYDGHFAALTAATLLLTIVALMIHELAHAVVARSLGAPARVAVGNLMYTLVAQTDISAIWLAPKRMRYLAFLSGTIVDLVLASFLVDVLWAGDHGWITLQPTVVRPLLGALLFTFVGRILFQFLFYLRTDLYYVLGTAMNCRNLMSDTETLLRNVFFRLVRRPDRVVDQSGIPRRERRHIREYAGFYAIGRVFWLLVLIYFYLPLLWNYLEQFVLVALGRPHRFGLIDFLVAFTVVVLINGGGIYLWIRSLHRSWRRHRTRARP